MINEQNANADSKEIRITFDEMKSELFQILSKHNFKHGAKRFTRFIQYVIIGI